MKSLSIAVLALFQTAGVPGEKVRESALKLVRTIASPGVVGRIDRMARGRSNSLFVAVPRGGKQRDVVRVFSTAP